MEKLPDELCLHILRHVSLEDLTLRCSATSRALRRIANDADLWHHHLDRYHPRWRHALRDMGVDATVTPLRECVRLLTEAHDPDGESGCCRHHLTKGAACTCCTCRRHHRAGRRWQWGRLSSLVHGMDDEMRQMIAAAYDANAATYLQLISDYNERLRERRRERRRRRLRPGRRGPGRRQRRASGRRCDSDDDDSDDDSDDDRGRELIAELERMGILELRYKGRGLESVRWTEAAHRDLRPPLQGGLVCYTNAELYANLMRAHPELCDATGLDRLLGRCGEDTKSIDVDQESGSIATMTTATVNDRRAFSCGGGGGPLGSTSSTSPFGGTSTNTSSSLFGGGRTSSMFGGAGTGAATASTSLFGAPAASTGSSLFSATTLSTGGGLYGAPAASTGTTGGSSSTTGRRFGSTRPSTSLSGFTLSTPSTPPTSSSGFPSLGGFGAGTTSTTTASTGSSLFGSTTPGASTGLGSLGGLGGLTGGSGVPGAGRNSLTASPLASASPPTSASARQAAAEPLRRTLNPRTGWDRSPTTRNS